MFFPVPSTQTLVHFAFSFQSCSIKYPMQVLFQVFQKFWQCQLLSACCVQNCVLDAEHSVGETKHRYTLVKHCREGYIPAQMSDRLHVIMFFLE